MQVAWTIIEGRRRRNVVQEERGWKLFFLIPKLLLFRPARGGAKRHLSGGGSPSDEAKAVRAEQLASLGELSAARRALERAVMAPGTLAALAELTNQSIAHHAVPVEILEMEPIEVVQLDDNLVAKNIRIARRGAAPGTSEHLFPLLESDRTLDSLCQVAGFFATAQVPQSLGFAVGTDDSSAQTIWRYQGHRGWRRLSALGLTHFWPSNSPRKLSQLLPRSSTHSAPGRGASVCVPRAAVVD